MSSGGSKLIISTLSKREKRAHKDADGRNRVAEEVRDNGVEDSAGVKSRCYRRTSGSLRQRSSSSVVEFRTLCTAPVGDMSRACRSREDLDRKDGLGAFAMPEAGRGGMRRRLAHPHDVKQTLVSLLSPNDAKLKPTSARGVAAVVLMVCVSRSRGTY